MLLGLLKRIKTALKTLSRNATFIAFILPPSPYTLTEIQTLKQHFLTNLTETGAVMASPSKTHPDYYYHWVRDAAIAMSLVESWYEKDLNYDDEHRLKRYVSFANTLQHALPTPGFELLGEPKFYLDGRTFTDPWGRPQNDGPALRALTLIRFANTLLAHPDKRDYVREHLYQPSLDYDAMGVIKRDLEFIASHWRDKSVDLWEESRGYHFFTAAVQRSALLAGAKLAERLNDENAARFYKNEALEMKSLLSLFIDRDNHRIKASLLQDGPEKTDNIDSSIILGVLKAQGTLDIPSEISNNTIATLIRYFKNAYPINVQNQSPLIGRYPNDTYDGYETNKLGNPWPLLTASLAEYHYEEAIGYVIMEDYDKASTLLDAGDKTLMRLKAYTKDNHLSEQLNRETGIQQGAHDLTWSYQALLHALSVRDKLVNTVRHPKYLAIKDAAQ